MSTGQISFVPAGSAGARVSCTRCVMDSSDPDLRLDAAGYCQYCTAWLERIRCETIDGNPELSLGRLVARIKAAGRGRDYDCILGVSGGVDSTYVAWLAKQQGLRPLAVHFDNGWNSELAVDNIRGALEKLQIDLHTHVVDWEEFRDLQRAFIKAGVTNLEIPTDHGINALLHNTAARHGVKYILSGGNIRNEGIYPRAWGWYNLDLCHLRAVHRAHGTVPLRTFPQLSLARFAWNTLWHGVRVVPVLNYVDFSKTKAVELLRRELGWRPYGGKHYESIFTRFYQGWILPRKYGVDKRRAHLTTLVLSGEMTREQALAELAEDAYAGQDAAGDRDFFLKKFDLTPAEFDEWMHTPPTPHTAYANNGWFFEKAPALKRWAKRVAARA
jgi:N-acetyl sugar amidotransferase